MHKEWTLISERYLQDWAVRQTKIGYIAYPLIERTYFRPSNGKSHDLISKMEFGTPVRFPEAFNEKKYDNVGAMYHVTRIAAEVNNSLRDVLGEPELMKPINWLKLAEDHEKNKKKTTTKTKK